MTVVHRSPDPSVEIPFVVAMVELLEGLKVVGNVAFEDGLSIGDDVVLRFDESERRPQIVTSDADESASNGAKG